MTGFLKEGDPILPPSWVFLAVPLALLCLAYLISCAIEFFKEQCFLRAVFDGDRIQQERANRWQAKQFKRNIKKLAARSGRRFY